jgi:superfamily I DNA/RNA helicase
MPLKPILLKGEQKRVLFLPPKDPIQIKGVAGSGKTTVALYRAKHLIDTQSNLFQEARVAIFTYNKTLVKYINAITPYISGGYQQDSEEIKPKTQKGINVTITNFHKWAYDFIKNNGIDLYGKTVKGDSQNVIIENIKNQYKQVSSNIANKKAEFFNEEISWMKGKAFNGKEEYQEAKRTGRGTNDRVSKSDKEIIWNIYTEYNSTLKANGQVDFDDYALLCLKIINAKPNFQKPFTHIVIDEAQDLSKAQILVISKIVSDETKSISIIADAAQRIYKSGFTWSEVGLNVKGGRTIEFKKNYRNTIQILRAALSLLEKEQDKSDFTTVEAAREGEQKPIVGYFKNWDEQCQYLDDQLIWLKNNDNINSTVILHRNHDGIRNIKIFLETNNHYVQELRNSEDIDFENDAIKLSTLSSAKGLEFDNVFIIDLNDDVIPYPAGFNDENDEFHISTERRLLYTSMTRARERLYLLSSGKPSRYLSEIDENLLEKIESSDNPIVMDIYDDLPF